VQVVDNDSNRSGSNEVLTVQVQGYSCLGRMAVFRFLNHDIDNAALWTTPPSAALRSISSISAASNESSSSSSLASPSQQLREGHWLWSFGAWLDWQHRSGWMLSATTKPGCVIGAAPAVADNYAAIDEISSELWFGYMNFKFSVAILLGLEKSGIPIGPATEPNMSNNQNTVIRVQLMDATSRNLVECDKSVQKSIDSWSRFF
jgi:hypothetical protein